MKRNTLIVLLFIVISSTIFAQNIDLYKDSQPASTNAPGVEFPKIDNQNKAIFRVDAPAAQKVQLDLGKVYDMVKDSNGIWTVTTNPLAPGFHYYYLIIDGFRFSDSASETLITEI